MAFPAGNVSPHQGLSRTPAAADPTPAENDAAGRPPRQSGAIVVTDIPARLDALPFGRFHLLVIIALGITWILDGLGVTLTRDLSGELKSSSPRGSAAGPTC